MAMVALVERLESEPVRRALRDVVASDRLHSLAPARTQPHCVCQLSDNDNVGDHLLGACHKRPTCGAAVVWRLGSFCSSVCG